MSPFPHPSGLANASDRTPVKPSWAGMIFREGVIVQGAELNEAQSIIRNRNQRVGNLTSKDGDRIEGADIIVNFGAGTVQLTAGKVYVKGDVRPIAGAVLTGVPMVGEVRIGVRLTSSAITELDDADLLGQEPGTLAEGEKGAGREIETVSWGRDGDGGTGALYAVYTLQAGVAIDQSPPPSLSGVNAAIAGYDLGAHGHYVVSGCDVSPLGLFSGKQVFTIAAGEANINGFKRTRLFDLRHEEVEAPDLAEVEAEPRAFTGVGTTIFTPFHLPVSGVYSVTVEKEIVLENVTHGGISGSQDSLAHSSILTLVQVKQGATIYTAGTDYILTADKVDWTPGGAEPAPSSSYQVTYRYYDVVPFGTGYTFTGTAITVNGGVTGGNVILRYTFKLPRVDILCLNAAGNSVYVKGLSSATNPQPPLTPTQLLLLATITNDWINRPTVDNAGIRSIQFLEMWRYFQAYFNTQELVALERLKSDIDFREPVAKLGTFVDPFRNDCYRDAGVGQSAAIVDGSLQLAIDPTIYVVSNVTTMLNYTDEIVINQPLATVCVPINPYQNFDPLPAKMTITPAQDFWVETQTLWLSEITRQIIARDGVGGRSEVTQKIDNDRTLIPFLRQIPVAYTITGFGAGEVLTTLTFDGLNVKPVGTITASAGGVITNTFNIPANVSAGTKILEAVGAGGSKATAYFVGQGTLVTDIMQRIITIANVPVASRQDNSNTHGEHPDPQAQTFTLLESRHITGFDLKFCAKGTATNRVIVEMVKVRDGTPTRDVVAQATVDMSTVVLNVWTAVRTSFPTFVEADIEYAFVVKTNDAIHAISMARLGDFDAVNQKYVGAQPYSIGVNADSSNASSWNFNQDRDITFRANAALFSPTTKTVPLGTYALVDCSDLLVLAGVVLPTEAANVKFEIVRPTGQVYTLAPGQWLPLTEYLNESVIFRAVLTGTSKISPTLLAGVTLVAGKIRASGTYVTRAFKMGTAKRITNYYKALLPAGSTVTVEIDDTTNTWVAVPLISTTALDGGWVDKKQTKDPYTAVQGRLRVTITGGSAARPKINDFNAVVI